MEAGESLRWVRSETIDLERMHQWYGAPRDAEKEWIIRCRRGELLESS